MKSDALRLRTVLAVLIAIAFSALILAHTHLEKTEPVDGATLKAAPAHVELWFNEKPDLTVSKITIGGPAGAVAVGPTHLMSDKSITADVRGQLSDGEYLVSWQAAGDDGHVSKGEFRFSVKSAQ
jgi:methionine-rich copper-binding protein CopC